MSMSSCLFPPLPSDAYETCFLSTASGRAHIAWSSLAEMNLNSDKKWLKCMKVLASARAGYDCGEAEAGIAVVEKIYTNPRMDMNVFRSLSQASLQKDPKGLRICMFKMECSTHTIEPPKSSEKGLQNANDARKLPSTCRALIT